MPCSHIGYVESGTHVRRTCASAAAASTASFSFAALAAATASSAFFLAWSHSSRGGRDESIRRPTRSADIDPFKAGKNNTSCLKEKLSHGGIHVQLFYICIWISHAGKEHSTHWPTLRCLVLKEASHANHCQHRSHHREPQQ